MSGNEQPVIAALAHSEPAIRDRALETLGSAYPNSAEAMPAIIRAIEQYGWDDAFAGLHHAQFLPQSRETIRWAWEKLLGGISQSGEEWYCYDLACIIAYAHPAVRDREGEAEFLAKTRPGIAAILARPMELGQLSDDELWQRFEAEAEKWDENQQEGARIEALQFGVALGVRGERFASQLLEALNVVDQERIDARARAAATALGIARYRPAIKRLMDYHQLGDTVHLNLAERALSQIGGSEVVVELKERAKDDAFFEHIGSRIFGVVQTEESLLAGLEVFQRLRRTVAKLEELEQGRIDFAADLTDSLLFHFDPRAVEAAAEIARAMRAIDYADGPLEDAAAVTATLLNVEFPERAEWFQMATEEAETARSREEFAEPVVGAGGQVLYEGFDPTNLPPSTSINVAPMELPRRRRRLVAMRPTPDPETRGDKRLIPIRRPDTPIGRNDPCPCGSGKKYKNCCFRKA